MADFHIGNNLRVVDKRSLPYGSSPDPMSARATQYYDLVGKKARLNAISATSYSPARLMTMTENDINYALRLADDAAGI